MVNMGDSLSKLQPKLEYSITGTKWLMPRKKICFLIYNTIKHLNCKGKYTSPWLGYVKGTLENCGLKSVWIFHVQSGSGVSSECVKRILQDQFLKKWFSRISQEEKFSTYKIYKDIQEFEECIDILLERVKYSPLVFRIGSQNCQLFVGQNYQYLDKSASAPIAEREFHFLFECNDIEKLKISALPKYHRTRCSTLKCGSFIKYKL